MNPKITGTRMTRSCIEIEPLLFWRFLVSTGACKLRLSGIRLRGIHTFLFLPALGRERLLLLHRQLERFDEIRQLGFLIGAERTYEMWRDHDQQFGGGFLVGMGFEEIAQDRNIAEPDDLIGFPGYAIVDEAGDREAFALLQDDFCFSAPLRDRGDEEALQGNGVGVIER